MKADLDLLQRIEARTEQPRQPFAPRPPFDASVRQADGIGAIKVRITARTAAGATTYSAIGDPKLLADAAYNAGALGLTMMVTK